MRPGVATTEILVLKFGSSVLRTRFDLAAVVAEIKKRQAFAQKLVVVVSAFGGVTNRLIEEAKQNFIAPAAPDYARYVGAGEWESAEALQKAANRAGLAAVMMTPRAIGFVARGDRLNAQPQFLDPYPLRNALEETDIVIIPGFSAVDASGDPVLLGRGGSDISAIFIAHALGCASVSLIKDVDGLYDEDPNISSNARRFVVVSWARALDVCGALIQHEALRFAENCGLPVEITAIDKGVGTMIGNFEKPIFGARTKN